MPSLGIGELALIVVVAFLLFGPKELPTIIRGLSKFMRQCREAIDECKAQIDAMGEETGLKEGRKYITDQFGELREVYDVEEVVAMRGKQDSVIASEAKQSSEKMDRRVTSAPRDDEETQ